MFFSNVKITIIFQRINNTKLKISTDASSTAIMFPEDSYSKALEDAGLKPFFYRREELCKTLFKQIIESNGQHKLAGLLPACRINERYHFRKMRLISMPFVKTNIMHYADKE